MEDLLDQPKIDALFTQALPEIEAIYELRKAKTEQENVEANLHSLKEIETYIKLMDYLGSEMKAIHPKSKGLQWLWNQVMVVYESEEYQHLKENSGKMMDSIGGIKSITLGVNLDTSRMVAKEIGVLSIQGESYHSGDLIDRLLSARLRKDEYTCLTPLVSVKAAEGGTGAMLQAVNEAITRIYKKAFTSFGISVKNYMRCNTDYLIRLYGDIMFLHQSYQLLDELRKKGYPICKPEIVSKEEKAYQVIDSYHLVLSRKEERHLVQNSVTFDEQGMFYIITGPNHGGKSVFLHSIGIVQAMAQLGLFVPARKARISLVDQIYTHFPAESADEIGKGRFGEECARLSEILKDCTSYSMILMDESLSSTSSIEGAYIANEVLKSIATIGCRGGYVTHMHELCNQVEKINQTPAGTIRIDHLVAQIDEDEAGKRSYKVIRTKPDGLSYARDIAEKYGLVYEELMKNHKEKS